MSPKDRLGHGSSGRDPRNEGVAKRLRDAPGWVTAPEDPKDEPAIKATEKAAKGLFGLRKPKRGKR